MLGHADGIPGCSWFNHRVTYSIVARDNETGELGVGVQSQAFNTGAAVPWVRPGVGAIATQSFTDRRYGYRGLELLADKRAPQEALDELLEPDDDRAFRQVAFLDASGRSAQWTGEHCVPACGHVAGDGWAAQGNMLAADAWHAMGAAFEAASGPLAMRLLAALDAAEAEGGDWRGTGGAAIVVVPPEGDPWLRVVDIRVEDASLPELRRLVERSLAYRAANHADDGAIVAAERGLPASYVKFLALLDAAKAGHVEEGRHALGELEAEHPRWRDFARSFSRHPEGQGMADILGNDDA
jgi:uncharacterized Ntn-hydrolase superfamily protein